ncbi:hypothetical protein IP70_16675 [alpha proteobacterium AAP38]|nr:hypothetical protein IP70_16675 [alpha proteobacterium AAP38]
MSAVIMGAIAGVALGTMDQHLLIQSRGVIDGGIRAMRWKIRLLSVLVIVLAFLLSAVATFKDDIKRKLATAGETYHAALITDGGLFAAQWDKATADLNRAAAAADKEAELKRAISNLTTQEIDERMEWKLECDGATTGNQTRVKTCGPKASGHETTANAMLAEIAAKRRELTQLGNTATNLEAARDRMTELGKQVDAQVEKKIEGASRQMAAMLEIVRTEPSSWPVLLFWGLIGFLPDLLIFMAQSASPNRQEWVRIHQLEVEVLNARLGGERVRKRKAAGQRFAPMEVTIQGLPANDLAGKFRVVGDDLGAAQ